VIAVVDAASGEILMEREDGERNLVGCAIPFSVTTLDVSKPLPCMTAKIAMPGVTVAGDIADTEGVGSWTAREKFAAVAVVGSVAATDTAKLPGHAGAL